MSFFARVKEALSGNRHVSTPSIMRFKQIDLDGTAKRLSLVDQAKANGAKEQPSSDSQEMDYVEQSIISEIEADLHRSFGEFIEQQKNYIDRAGSLAIENLIVEIGNTARSAVASYKARLQHGLNRLYTLRREVIDAERDSEEFRARHRLRRPARNLDNGMYKIGALVLLLAVEMFANGVVIGAGAEGGYLEGLIIALVIAVINVGWGVIAGRFFMPLIMHRNWGIKLIGVALMLGYAAGAVFINLMVAHFRAAVEISDAAQAAKIAWQTFAADFRKIEDMRSWLLFGIGMLCSLIAMLDALLMDDPYPGYGTKARHHRDAAELYTDEMKELLDELDTVKETAATAIEERLRDIAARRGEFDYLLAASQALQLNMSQHFDHIESSVNALLRLYRTENIKHRKTAAPARFDGHWTCPRPSLDNQCIPESIRTQIVAAIERATREVPERHADVISAYENALTEYRRIDQLTAKDLAVA
jgi:hypothetical protein